MCYSELMLQTSILSFETVFFADVCKNLSSHVHININGISSCNVRHNLSKPRSACYSPIWAIPSFCPSFMFHFSHPLYLSFIFFLSCVHIISFVLFFSLLPFWWCVSAEHSFDLHELCCPFIMTQLDKKYG